MRVDVTKATAATWLWTDRKKLEVTEGMGITCSSYHITNLDIGVHGTRCNKFTVRVEVEAFHISLVTGKGSQYLNKKKNFKALSTTNADKQIG